MKKELTIREWLKARDRMCASMERCRECPAGYWCTGYKDIPEGVLDAVEQWAAEHPEPKRTMLVPDEIVRTVTVEMTTVIPQAFLELIGREMTEQEIGAFKDEMRKNLDAHYAYDDLHIKVQQFITKAHEEDA